MSGSGLSSIDVRNGGGTAVKGASVLKSAASHADADIERELQAKGLTAPRLTAPRLTPADIDTTIVGQDYYVFPGTTLTVCALRLRNGFVVTGESAAASPENFNGEIGRKIARDNARNKIWQLEGYLLRERLSHASAERRGQDDAVRGA